MRKNVPLPGLSLNNKILHMQERPTRHEGTPLYLCFHRQKEVGQKQPYHLDRTDQVMPFIGSITSEEAHDETCNSQ